MDKYVIFLRKKIEGQNSIEEIASILTNKIKGVVIKNFPTFGRTPIQMLKNIIFAVKNQGRINHFISPSDPYVIPFIKNKTILTWHDLNTLYQSKSSLKRFYRKIFYLWPTLFANKITTISNFTKTELLKALPWLKKGNVIVIYNPINSQLKYTPKKDLSTPPIIFHPGTAKRKNLDKVIEAISGLDVILNIVGKLNENQKALLKKFKINYNNAYDVTYDEMIKYYKESDIVSFPSSYEGFGVPVIEAQAIGRPVITSDIPPIREIAQNSAILLNKYNPQILRQTFIDLLSDKNKRDELIGKGIENAKRFSSDTISNQYLKLYNSLI